MKTNSKAQNPQSETNPESAIRKALPRGPLTLAALGLALLPAGAIPVATNLQFNADLTLKESYDSNVYIQNAPANPAGVAAAAAAGLTAVQPEFSSWVTTVTPRLALDWKPSPEFSMLFAYAPEIALYTQAEEEDNITHRGTLNFGGKMQDVTWEFLNAETFIEGSTIGPTFARPDDVPAIGGIPLRDRREAFFTKNSFRVTVPAQDWFIRPAASFYHHNFLTDQRLSPTPNLWCYENYIDRQDVNGGVDFGYKVSDKTFAVLGYRFGAQNQYELLGVNSPYQCHYNRVLFGVEGSPWPWLKLNFTLGPEFRQYEAGTPAGFDPSETLYYVDATVAVLPTAADTVAFKWTRFEQPAYSSFSVYQDIKYDLTWRHKFDRHLTAGAGFTAYGGVWQLPVLRNDWIFTPTVMVGYTFSQHWAAELSYAYDWCANLVNVVPGTQTAYADNRGWTRNLVSLSVKWSL